MNIIADVAGQFDALMRLMHRLPFERTVFLGDLIDRGPMSREVVDFVRVSGYECVLANHEHFMIDFVRRKGWYEKNIWQANGGRATLASYELDPFKDEFNSRMEEDVKWMEGLPPYIETDRLFLSHAPWRKGLDLEEATRVLARGPMMTEIPRDDSLLWCRDEPEDRLFDGKRKLQVFGHNSYWGIMPFLVGAEEQKWNDAREQDPYYLLATSNPVPVQGELFALCIDNSWMQKVTGLHVDDETGALSIYQEKYA